MSEKTLSFADQLFDQTTKVDADLSNLGAEISKVQQVITRQSKNHEKFAKNCIIQKEKKGYEHFGSYMRELNDFSRQVSLIQHNFVKSCSMQVESLERLKKFLENSRRSVKHRQMNNEKIYLKKKKLLENSRRKQHKHAKEAHERYLKHDKLCRDESIEPSDLDDSELRFIHTAKMEEKFSQQYQDVFRYHQDYLDNYVRENREVLKTSEEYYLLVVKNMRAHMLRYVEDQEEIIVGMRKNMLRLKRNLESIDPEDLVQKYIKLNMSNSKSEIEVKHHYSPNVPIYKMGEIEREKELKKIEKDEEAISVDQHSRLQNFFGGMFGRVRKSQMNNQSSNSSSEGDGEQQHRDSRVDFLKKKGEGGGTRRRRGTQKVYNKMVRSPRFAKRSVIPQKNESQVKSESQVFYESLYDELSGFRGESEEQGDGENEENEKTTIDDEKSEDEEESEEDEGEIQKENNDEEKEQVEEKEEEEKKKKIKKKKKKKKKRKRRDDSSSKIVLEEEEEKEGEKEGLTDAKKKKALGWLEMVEGRRGLVSAMNLKRNQPYIEDNENFNFLGELIAKCLTLSHKKQDSGIGSNLLNMSQTFYTIKNDNQLFYFKHLNKLEIWKNIRFWEACFYDLMTNMRKRSVHYQYQERWRDMDEVRRKEVRKEHANMTYGILTSFIFSMMESKVESSEVRSFVVKMCEINGLDTEQVKLIMSGYETMSQMKKKSKN